MKTWTEKIHLLLQSSDDRMSVDNDVRDQSPAARCDCKIASRVRVTGSGLRWSSCRDRDEHDEAREHQLESDHARRC